MKQSPLSFFLFLIAAFSCGGVFVSLFSPQQVLANSSDGGRRYVAVTGNYSPDVALLYVLDQETQHLVVYEARGGASNSHELKLVGARNIELDTQLDGYNDKSDYSHKELERQFLKSGIIVEEQ
ncbi:MAG: hypothetical protein QGF46_04310 [Planctomycetota bacterium]|jgi:hypothetical protein|nr:hypothetical protein [Planctomycetota bacterium]